jgi:hypothetical protein
LKKETSEDLGIFEGDDEEEEQEEQEEVQLCYMVYVMCDHVHSMIIQFANFYNSTTLLQIPGHFVFWKFWRWLSNGFNLEISGYWNWRLMGFGNMKISGFWKLGD